MRDNTNMAIKVALTHLRVYRTEIDTAITALEALLGHADMVLVQPPAERTRTAKAPRATAPVPTTSPKALKAATRRVDAETPDTPDTPDMPDTDDMPETRDADRAKPGAWQERALRALAMGPGDVQVRELVTRLRVKDKDRDAANTRIWGALQALVKAGQVTSPICAATLDGSAC